VGAGHGSVPRRRVPSGADGGEGAEAGPEPPATDAAAAAASAGWEADPDEGGEGDEAALAAAAAAGHRSRLRPEAGTLRPNKSRPQKGPSESQARSRVEVTCWRHVRSSFPRTCHTVFVAPSAQALRQLGGGGVFLFCYNPD